jgi:short-subunit dehydrogenase
MNVVLIGASQGIGKSLAFEYASTGAKLVLLSRNIEAIKEISDKINSTGGQSFYKECDVSSPGQVKEGIEFAVNTLGTIDTAIINSGVGSPEWMDNFTSEEFKRVYGVNIFGLAHAFECLLPIMKKQGYGKIAGVSSMADSRGYPGSAAYCSSKAAASIFLESARIQLKKFNIRVISVKPGFVRTAMTDKNEFYMPFLMKPEKAARIIRKGIDRGRSVVQFPFPIVLLTWFVRFLPNWIFDPAIRISRGIKKKK